VEHVSFLSRDSPVSQATRVCRCPPISGTSQARKRQRCSVHPRRRVRQGEPRASPRDMVMPRRSRETPGHLGLPYAPRRRASQSSCTQQVRTHSTPGRPRRATPPGGESASRELDGGPPRTWGHGVVLTLGRKAANAPLLNW